MGQATYFFYDSLKRPSKIHRFAASGAFDSTSSPAFYYDTNPLDSAYTQNGAGRLTAIQWGDAASVPGQFTQMYTYTASGRPLGKRLLLQRGASQSHVDLDYTYDNEGRITSIGYPDGKTLLTYTHDSLGRPSSISQSGTELVRNVSYSPADRLLSIDHQVGATPNYVSEQRSYTPWNQLAALSAKASADSASPGMVPNLDLQYQYAPDARLTSQTNQTDHTGATYSYDSRGRIATAASTGPDWGLSAEFDGFGNRSAQNVTKGSAPAFSAAHNAANNHLVGVGYDANGNITAFSGTQLTYDTQNRLVQSVSGAGTEEYAYDPQNRRVWKRCANGAEELYLYGVDGKRLATVSVQVSNGVLTLPTVDTNVHFAGRMIRSRNESVVVTRLHHVKAWADAQSGSRSTGYLPYGEERTTTLQEREKFGSYVRDAASGLDYAHNRYYSNQLGRFITPDPYDGSARLEEPDSWNRYSFVSNDPINRVDPRGTDDFWSSGGYSGYTDDGGGGYCTVYPDGVNTQVSSSLVDPTTANYQAAGLLPTPPPYTGPASDGTLDDSAVQILSQVGQNVAGFDAALGVFAGGSVIAGAGLAASGVTSAGELTSMVWNQPTTVIGNSTDVAQYAGNSAYNVLYNDPNWSIGMNQSWIQTAVNAGQSVMLASPLIASNFYDVDYAHNDGFRVLGMEAGWLVGGAGYDLVDSFFVPPVP